jgi:hypothetical protein
MTPFKHIDMTFIVVSFRGKELTEGQHRYGQTDKGRAERHAERHRDRQTDI